MKSLSRVWLFVTPWTVANQAPPSMGFSRQEYWSGLPFPSPGGIYIPAFVYSFIPLDRHLLCFHPLASVNNGAMNIIFTAQLLSRVWLFGTPWTAALPGLPVHHHLLEFAQVHVHCIGDAIQPSHPLTPSLLLPSIFPSIRDFSNESSIHIKWPKWWSFSISPPSEY